MDKLKIARCLNTELDTFIATLNDYTLLLVEVTGALYTKVNGVKVELNATAQGINNKMGYSSRHWFFNRVSESERFINCATF